MQLLTLSCVLSNNSWGINQVSARAVNHPRKYVCEGVCAGEGDRPPKTKRPGLVT